MFCQPQGSFSSAAVFSAAPVAAVRFLQPRIAVRQNLPSQGRSAAGQELPQLMGESEIGRSFRDQGPSEGLAKATQLASGFS